MFQVASQSLDGLYFMVLATLICVLIGTAAVAVPSKKMESKTNKKNLGA